ncbi:lytic transglycosylase domain-containing protein [Kineococcus arenarius]|uniref:lytic transglycosylase domain-containing protein n=1 Tax=Kineococcus sp. SYSU DK007 TaxID=3383128 RepID=UPI003D7C6BAB
MSRTPPGPAPRRTGALGTGLGAAGTALVCAVLAVTGPAGAPLVGPAPASAAPTPASASAGTSADGSARGARAAAEAARAAAQGAAQRVREVEDALERQQEGARRAASAAVGAQVRAERALAAAESARADGTRRVRALYMAPAGALTGSGTYALVRSLLTGSDPSATLRAHELSSGRAVDAGARADQRATGAAADGARTAVVSAEDADRAAGEQVAALRDLAARSGQLQQALQQAQDRLDALDADAARLEAAERAAQELAAAAAAARTAQAAAAGAGAGVRAGGAPADYADLYARAATTCPGMRPALLQAVGQVESGHGRDVGPSSAGAIGPMQFMPATFAAYGVDGDGDGDTDAWDPADAVFSAARYLCANGAGAGRAGESGALFRYNHADWYVVMVQRIADEIDAGT